MSQKIGNGLERRTPTDQSLRHRMAEDVWAADPLTQSRGLGRGAHGRADDEDRRGCPVRRMMAKEERSSGVARPTIPNIVDNRLARGHRQRHDIDPMPFAADTHGSRPPVKVIELQTSYLDRA